MTKGWVFHVLVRYGVVLWGFFSIFCIIITPSATKKVTTV